MAIDINDEYCVRDAECEEFSRGKRVLRLEEGNYTSVPDDSQVIYQVTQSDGLVGSAQKNISEVKLAGYTVGADNSGKIAATDTLGIALGKLQGQINGLDVSDTPEEGKIVTSVSQTDGKVQPNKTLIKDIKVTGYQKGDNSGAISPNDTLNEALSKLENADEGILDEIENNELVTSAALNDLNSRIITINNTIDALDDYDSAESGKFVTDVVQINGKVVESNKSFITKTISADSSVETPNSDLVDVVKNTAINFTTNPNQTISFESTKVPTKKYVDDQVAEVISGVYKYKGSKNNYSDLPTSGNTSGDVWNVSNESTVGGITYPAGTNWAWNGSSWDPLGGQVHVVNNEPTLGTTATVIGIINGHSLTAKIPTQLWKEAATAGYITPSTTTRNSLNGIDTIEATTIYQTSDRNMKQNINSISQDDLAKVSNVELRKFEIKNNPGIKYGVIAQEVQDAGLQNLVESNDGILRVDYISLLCLKIAALEEEIKQLKK